MDSQNKMTAENGQGSEQPNENKVFKEVIIRYTSPTRFKVFIDGVQLTDVHRFSISSTQGEMFPRYTVEHNLINTEDLRLYKSNYGSIGKHIPKARNQS